MKLQNHRLQITLEHPSTMRTPRFSHAGFITEVLLDGTYQFCMPEQLLPDRRNSPGFGLCGEFVLPTGELTRCGDWFFKPGVGLVRQTADFQKFNIFGTYEIQPFPVTVQQPAEDTILFHQTGASCHGYGAEICKTYHLENHQLLLDTKVTNTGSEILDLSEYQHNFISLEGKSIGPGYVLELPCDKNIKNLEQATLRQGDEAPMDSIVSVRDQKIHWMANSRDRILYHESYDVDSTIPACWTLSHEASPVSVMEEVNFTPDMIIVWSVEHCVCAELYYRARILPGDCVQWRRTWTFKNNGW